MSLLATPQPNYKVLIIWSLLAVMVGLVGKWLHSLHEQLNAEYNTASVIRKVTDFVEANGGRWPHGWVELPEMDYARRWTRIDFSVTAEELLADRQRIYQAIVPKTGTYHTYPHSNHTYPHSKRDLDRLWDVLAGHHARKPEQPDPVRQISQQI